MSARWPQAARDAVVLAALFGFSFGGVAGSALERNDARATLRTSLPQDAAQTAADTACHVVAFQPEAGWVYEPPVWYAHNDLGAAVIGYATAEDSTIYTNKECI